MIPPTPTRSSQHYLCRGMMGIVLDYVWQNKSVKGQWYKNHCNVGSWNVSWRAERGGDSRDLAKGSGNWTFRIG